ncbi:purple acid phosphatase 22-like, partial [Trifolium medium]|nr:purple acid phosphatase 22-like [Trifolium medium]
MSMAKCNISLVVIPLFLHILCLLLFPHTLQSQENGFSRQPSREFVFTSHERSDSDPQQ